MFNHDLFIQKLKKQLEVNSADCLGAWQLAEDVYTAKVKNNCIATRCFYLNGDVIKFKDRKDWGISIDLHYAFEGGMCTCEEKENIIIFLFNGIIHSSELEKENGKCVANELLVLKNSAVIEWFYAPKQVSLT